MTIAIVAFITVVIAGLWLVLRPTRRLSGDLATTKCTPDRAPSTPLRYGLNVDVDSSPLTKIEIQAEGMPHYMLIDTETVELIPEDSLGSSLDSPLTLLVLSWQVLSESGLCLAEESHIVRSLDREISKEAVAIHSISSELMQTRGQDRDRILRRWIDAMRPCKVIVAHNLEFHLRVLKSALKVEGLEVPELYEAERICTMIWGESLGCKRSPRGQRCYPSVAELFSFLHFGHLGTRFYYRNKSLRDLRLLSASLRLYLKLYRSKLIKD